MISLILMLKNLTFNIEITTYKMIDVQDEIQLINVSDINIYLLFHKTFQTEFEKNYLNIFEVIKIDINYINCVKQDSSVICLKYFQNFN